MIKQAVKDITAAAVILIMLLTASGIDSIIELLF